MRDIFDDIFKTEPVDPQESARRGSRPQLRRRFYERAATGEQDGGWRLLLDGKPAWTPARLPLAAPNRELGEALAQEWDAQHGAIDPARMPLTRLVNSIIDGVTPSPALVADEIAKYLATDLLFYRADAPPGLVAKQAQQWDPVLDWAHHAFGARFILSQGVMHVAQPEAALARVRSPIPADPWRLGALHVATTLTGSALMALALAHRRLSPEDAWSAAHVDEDWNMDFWGRDEVALQRRAFRWAEMQAAALMLRHLPLP